MANNKYTRAATTPVPKNDRVKYMKFDGYDLSRFNVDTYDYIKLPFESSGKLKVLFVLDHMPTEDLQSGKMLSGQTGDLLGSLISATKKAYGAANTSFSWLACSFNAFRTYGKASNFRAQADAAFTKRVEQIICKYKPDYVVVFGTSVMRALLPEKLKEDDKGRLRYSYWLGVPIKKTFNFSKSVSHETTVVANISLNDIISGDSTEANLLGYMCKCLAPIFGKTYIIDSEKILSNGLVVIDTMKRFERLMDTLAEKEFIAVDTETRNLNKITNQLLTAQFAYDETKGFLLPISHKDSPFRPNEIRLIHGRLKEYFEGANNNKYHVYTNAKFDITQFRSACGIRYYANPVWDILGGDFAMDECLKFLDSVIGEYYYSLGNLAVQYGYEGYLNAEFSKQHRADFYNADLNDPEVQKYTCLDVCVPIAIHNQQKIRAADQGYTAFSKVVLNEISDTIHAFSKMEHTGAGLDVSYLFYLRTENSPIEVEIGKMRTALLSTKAAATTNKLLCDKEGIPTTSMFNEALPATVLLKLNKPDHRRMFFFDVLKLAPLDKGKSGSGKIDKKFQTTYAHVPEVAQYTALEKAKKLKTSFVNSFIQLLGTSEDLQKDHRIRPDFGYITIITHRTGCRNPNLQQIPAHSALGKHIKRLFIAREGCLYIKVDYRVHEVRGWGIISFDKAVAATFAAAKKLRDAYRLHPTKELAKRIKVESDIHVQNVMIFFVKTLEQINAMEPKALKDLRSAVKGIIFGFIYGMGLKSMSENIKQDEDFTKNLLATFAKRFPKAVAWSRGIKEFARTNLFVEAPTKIRRHLWGYLLPSSVSHSSKVAAQNDRQAGNAPIQGMCSKFAMNGIRLIDKAVFDIQLKKPEFELYITNSVHDSVEIEAGYSSFLHSLGVIEWNLTSGVKNLVMKRYGFELVSEPEIDFEIGAALSQTEGWDFNAYNLERLVLDSVLFQRNKLGYKLDPDMTCSIIFSKDAVASAPAWLRTQLKNTGYSFGLTEKEYIRELLAKGKLLIAEAGDDASKKQLLAEGQDLVEYARELNNLRRRFASA